MKTESILQLIARLFSIYLLSAFVLPPISLFLYPGGNESFIVKAQLISALLVTALAAFFWFFPHKLAHKILPMEKERKTSSSIALEDLQTLCFAVLGMWVCIRAIVPILQIGPTFIWDAFQGKPLQGWNKAWIGHFIQFMIGLWVMLGSKGVMGFIAKLRSIPIINSKEEN